MRKALIETKTGLVVNIIEIEADSGWLIPKGHTLRDAYLAETGDTWDRNKYVKPITLPLIAKVYSGSDFSKEEKKKIRELLDL